MGDLHVTVRYHGFIVEDAVVPVRGAVRIGDGPGSRVAFPGASVTVCRLRGDLDIRGRRLREGERTGFSLGAVHVDLEHLVPLKVRPRTMAPVDVRFLVVALAVTTGGMWVDTLAAWASQPPSASVAEWLGWARTPLAGELTGGHNERAAAVRPGELAQSWTPARIRGEGPEARPDDEETRWGYHEWYLQQLPSSLEGHKARIMLASQPDDLVLMARAARGAYERDDYREALDHYLTLTARQPENTLWLEGLARTQKRLGLHRDELESYARLLTLDPDSVPVMGNRAVALARLGDFEAAEHQLDEIRASDHPYVPVYLGIYAAIRGQESEAIAELEAAFASRGALPEAMRLELYRDLALDPALGPIRADRRMRSALYRHLGAAAPRPRR